MPIAAPKGADQPFWHLADGNIHFNLSSPQGADDFDGREGEIARGLAALASTMEGSFAAEHGLGRAKIALADSYRSPVERRMMAMIKHAFDPEQGLNSGVILARLPDIDTKG